MERIKLGVIGVCVTRDILNRRYVTDHFKYYTCVRTIFQSSIISAMAKPITIDKNLLECEMTDHHRRVLFEDVEKGQLDEMIKEKPEYIIIDTYSDIRWGLLQVGDSYLTFNNSAIRRTKFVLEQHYDRKIDIKNNYDEYMDLFKEAFDRFYNRIKEELPDTKIILHCSKYANSFINANNEIESYNMEQYQFIDKENELWRNLNNYVLDNYDVIKIDLTDGEYFGIHSHFAKNAPWHFESRYHNDFFSKLNKIVLRDLLDSREKIREIVK